MANIKISELNGITKKANDDVLAIVDVSADETKKIAVGDLLDKNVELIAVTDTEPAECLYGDKYFNTIDNLIYTAIATDTWSEDGEEPIEGIFYVVFGEQSSYAYNGTTLISVGGGTEDIVISDTQPTGDDWKIWIDSDEQTDNTYYNDNGTPTNIKTTTFDTLPVGAIVEYSGSTIPSGWTDIGNNQIQKTSQYIEGGASLPSYFTEEIDTGMKWIDGKPVYRKCYQITKSSTGEVVIGQISSLDVITHFQTYLKRNDNYKSINNFYGSSSDYATAYVDQNNNIKYTSSFTGTLYVVLEYTKTTD